MSDVKQVKVDNWGNYFLQRLKHFFNRTDYCDLTLQFQDNAQLKVHRLVLSACTEYFELLERTCEMYEDCLVMPDDLQSDVVVPIVNFMYTGHLEFKNELLERLYQTSQIMNMSVLTKLLDAQRNAIPKPPPAHSYSAKRASARSYDTVNHSMPSSSGSSQKRCYTKAFENNTPMKKKIIAPKRISNPTSLSSNSSAVEVQLPKRSKPVEPRPTRYEIPEELETENIFDNSFSSISYDSTPLMVHPETSKYYSSSRKGLFSDLSNSKASSRQASTLDIVECRKISNVNDVYGTSEVADDSELFGSTAYTEESPKDSNQLFDQIIDNNIAPKVTIESADPKHIDNIDHAKIISEVLKKYPHLVKSNKNIKLKILNTSNTKPNKKGKVTHYSEDWQTKVKTETDPDSTFESDVLDSKAAAKLIALGAENIRGPWICLICGTPGRALNFTTYYQFRRHLVEVHNEKPVSNICEYCGLKSLKRNYLLHHLYTKHGVEPPLTKQFPKCNICSYVALSEGFLIKHKMTHTEGRTFACNLCHSRFSSSSQLLSHIQQTGHKYSADRKTNLQCIYCFKAFLRESNLYAHLKTNHKDAAKADGVLEDSEEEEQEQINIPHVTTKPNIIKFETPTQYEIPITYEAEDENLETQYQIQQSPDGNIQILSKRERITSSTPPTKQKILNSGFTNVITKPPQKPKNIPLNNDFHEQKLIPRSDAANDDIIIINENEYIMQNNQLVLKKEKINVNEEYVLSDIIHPEPKQSLQTILPSTSIEYSTKVHTDSAQLSKMVMKKSGNVNQPFQIVVSSEQEYKAIMANPPIIYNEGDTNKTLTVMRTSEAATLDDIDNNHSNDMMIIQDDYPLNVSQAVTADNPNIVVVYSHPIEQSKEYQLVTPQDIGAEFDHTTEIITQTYETVTTSAPVVSAHIIDTHAQNSWPHNIPQEQHQIEGIEGIDNNAATENESINDENELPEVQLGPEESQPVSEDAGHFSESSLIITDSISNLDTNKLNVEQSNMVHETPIVESVPMEVDHMSESILENTNIAANDQDDQLMNIESESNETVTLNIQNESNESVTLNKKHSEETQGSIENIENTESIDEVAAEINEVPTNNKDGIATNEEVLPEIESTEQVETTIDENDMAVIRPITNVEPVFTEAGKEQVQNIALEWSEDDYDTVQEPAEVDENDDNVVENATITSGKEVPAEVEESIENIQQEMEKQVSAETNSGENLKVDLPKDTSPSSQDTEQLAEAPVKTNPDAREKLSSLLNDWEENDSQEGYNSTNGTEINAPVPHDALESNEANSPIASAVVLIKNPETPKDDKIKSLVSDWDDDEEENKE